MMMDSSILSFIYALPDNLLYFCFYCFFLLVIAEKGGEKSIQATGIYGYYFVLFFFFFS
jgi:hypothetical protein